MFEHHIVKLWRMMHEGGQYAGYLKMRNAVKDDEATLWAVLTLDKLYNKADAMVNRRERKGTKKILELMGTLTECKIAIPADVMVKILPILSDKIKKGRPQPQREDAKKKEFMVGILQALGDAKGPGRSHAKEATAAINSLIYGIYGKLDHSKEIRALARSENAQGMRKLLARFYFEKFSAKEIERMKFPKTQKEYQPLEDAIFGKNSR